MELTTDYTIKSVAKALKILKLFDYKHKEMTLTELSKLSDIRKGTMIRFVRTLQEEGFLIYDEKTKLYRLGFALYRLNSSAFAFSPIIKIARPYLEDVTHELNLIAHLGYVDEHKIILIDRVFPRQDFLAYDLNSVIGEKIFVHCTGIGKVITSFADESLRKGLLDSCSFEKRSDKTITDKDEFLDLLPEIRKNGYATNEGENEEYLMCITYPIFTSNHKICAALSLSGMISQSTKESDLIAHKRLKEIAAKISRKLGCSEF